MMTSFLAGFIALVVYLLLRPVIRRRLASMAPVPLYFLLALGMHGAAVLVGAVSSTGLSYWHGASLYWAGFMTDLFIFGAVYKSVSLTFLRALAAAPGESLAFEQISMAVALPCFADRAELLVEMGLAEKVPNGYQATAKGKRLAGRIATVQAFFDVAKPGLYDH